MWILIMTMVTFNGAAIGTAEFNTKQACEVAATEWSEKMKSGSRELTVMCKSKE